MSDTTEHEWIQYYPRNKENPVEMPTKGFVEFIDTFDPGQRTRMDMSVNNLERNIMWNHAAPRCVAKFRYITEKEFLASRILHYTQQFKIHEAKMKDMQRLIDEDNARMGQLA